MNRNILKIIAVVSMLIDHLGYFLLDNNIICRSIGRLAFPIFAFFISEGMRYTRNRKKYFITLLIFAIITQIPFGLLFRWNYFNVLFTFLIAIAFIILIESYNKEAEKDMLAPIKNQLITTGIIFLFIFALIGHKLNLYEYGLYGVLLVIAFYFTRSHFKILAGSLIILYVALNTFLDYGPITSTLYKWLPLLSMILLLFYNGKKGKLNLKYLFYIVYPANFLLFYLILLF